MVSYYCERISGDFFGEPYNAITNIFFIVSAILIFKLYRDYISSFSISFIGLSSFAFHTYPNSITGLLDVIAIVVFMLIFIIKIYKQLLEFKFLYSMFIAILFVLVCFFSGLILQNTILGTSSFYFPIILHLLFLINYFNKKKLAFNKLKYLYFSTILFSSSITLRIIDKKICSIFPIGTHFLWHIFNAIFLYYLIKFLYLCRNRSSPKKPS